MTPPIESETKTPWLRRVDTMTLFILLVLATAILGFVYLASQVGAGTPWAFDRWLLLHLRSGADPGVSIGPRWLSHAMYDFTALGGGAVLTLVTFLVTGYLMARRKAALAMFLASSIAAGGLFTALLKLIFARERPDIVPHLVEVSSPSFPSGHAMNSAMVYLTVAALLVSAERSRRVRSFLITTAIALTVIVGFTRVYLGVHFPTDVLAGWSIGAAWAIACSWAAGKLQARHALEGAEGTTTSIAR